MRPWQLAKRGQNGHLENNEWNNVVKKGNLPYLIKEAGEPVSKLAAIEKQKEVLFHVTITVRASVPTGAGRGKEAHRLNRRPEKGMTNTSSSSSQAQQSECKPQSRKLLYDCQKLERYSSRKINFKYISIPFSSGPFPIPLSPASAGDRMLGHNNL